MGHQTDVPMTAPSNFERLVMEFLRIKNGSNLERSLLSTIKSYDANGRKSKKILITLVLSFVHILVKSDVRSPVHAGDLMILPQAFGLIS